MLRLIGETELAAINLFTISSANPQAIGRAADEHQAAALFTPDRNGAPQLVSREDALCAFDISGNERKRVEPRRLAFTVLSAAVSGLNGANLDIGAITSKWSAPTYATRPGYTALRMISLLSVQPGMAPSFSLNGGEALHGALISNGLYFTLRDAGAMYPAGAAQGTASVRLSPAAITADIYEILPEARDVWPGEGYAQPGAAIAVTWTYFAEEGVRETPKQAAFELMYRTLRHDGTEGGPETIMGTSAKHATIPANATAEAEAIWYKLRLKSDDGVWGGWTEEFRLSAIPLSRQCAGVSPSGRYLSAGEDVTFVWRHASEAGLPQRGARIFASIGGGAFFPLADLTQREQSAALRVPSGFASGEFRWYAVTTDEGGAESLPSAPLSNILLGAPAAPDIEPIPNEARPIVAWRNDAQTAYQMRVYDEAEALRFGTGMRPGAEQQARVEQFLPPGSYTFEVAVWNEYGIFSAARRVGEITVPLLASPGISLSGIEGGVMVAAEPPHEYEALEIYRDSVRAARLSRQDSPVFADYRAHGDCRYFCRVIASDPQTTFPEQYGDSEAAVCTPRIEYPLLAPALRPEAFLRLHMRRGGAPVRKAVFEPDAAVRRAAGRGSVAELSMDGERTGALRTRELSFSTCDAEAFAALLAMIEDGGTLLYRDEDVKLYCVCARFAHERTPDGWDFTLELAEVGFCEEVE